MSRAVPKIAEKEVIYSSKLCGTEQNFAHGVFFLSWHIDRLLVNATVTYLRANLLHFNEFKI